jgi:hypothetical protein
MCELSAAGSFGRALCVALVVRQVAKVGDVA